MTRTAAPKLTDSDQATEWQRQAELSKRNAVNARDALHRMVQEKEALNQNWIDETKRIAERHSVILESTRKQLDQALSQGLARTKERNILCLLYTSDAADE